jgi:2-oxoglutarate ferredoxin oxidoreductase subunit alpha
MTKKVATKTGIRPPDGIDPIVNDFSMSVATVNGSGSQTANTAIMRSLFRMGIPVSGKNLFPSNIQGLPTWFTIRASAEGFTARRETVELLVAMNQSTFARDLAGLVSGGVCFYADHFAMPEERDDVIYYPIPAKDLIKEVDPPRELRDYVINMAYVGVVAQMIGIDLDDVRGSLETHFRGKSKPVDLNMRMIEAAANWAADNLEKKDAYIVERMQANQDLILIEGNTAAALGAIYGGIGFISWYPITPASSLAESLNTWLPRLRKDCDENCATYAVVQAEDELAAIGMAIGAGWAGVRSMTSTSGPGVSLMAEFAGLAYFAEVPVVVWNVQRMGPSTGLPTRTSQGDILFTRFLGHGDTNQVLLLPGSVAECFEFGWRAFDIAERLQTPVFVLSDLDLGMNIWMSEKFEYPDQPLDRGKVLTAEDLDKLDDYARYRDVDGDGIAYRTLPGTDHPSAAWFARGTGHDEYATYSEEPDEWTKNIDRINRKMETAKQYLPEPVIDKQKGAKIGLIAFGSTDVAIAEARTRLADDGIKTQYLRIRAVPFADEVVEFVEQCEQLYVIEMNTDGQMHKLLQLEMPDQTSKMKSIRHNDGLPLTARFIHEQVVGLEES